MASSVSDNSVSKVSNFSSDELPSIRSKQSWESCYHKTYDCSDSDSDSCDLSVRDKASIDFLTRSHQVSSTEEFNRLLRLDQPNFIRVSESYSCKKCTDDELCSQHKLRPLVGSEKSAFKKSQNMMEGEIKEILERIEALKNAPKSEKSKRSLHYYELALEYAIKAKACFERDHNIRHSKN